ncbi:PopZ family protein [Rhizobium halophytocola]|uniref:Cell pole-organizing protein PopZ n=1 Tax=Rhizobium halophytocola TaxID=735519 RepID=A0ABS4DW32_9HYPH|nr:PopZ family protein [Rhizobium halophytocola]MBP1849844.1 cell pole-organizing protein PopZ [Rhizobium halophytocola]
MAQPSVAREPSMEEILASIRKIIESNDVGPDRASADGASIYVENDMVELDDSARSLDDELDAATLSFDAANDAGPLAVSVESPLAPEQKTVSLADLAARVRATVQRAEVSLAPDMAAQPQPQAAPVEDSPVMTSRLASLRSSGPVTEAPYVLSPVAQPVEQSPEMAEVAEQMPMQDERAETMEAPVDASLVSAQTGALVAQSFSDLAAAVDGQQRRSLDEMAEELLRPMLQSWLDDNLPTMVERLVREEIERVARGPRR